MAATALACVASPVFERARRSRWRIRRVECRMVSSRVGTRPGKWRLSCSADAGRRSHGSGERRPSANECAERARRITAVVPGTNVTRA
ncbi:conserved hypothetical protein [Burkholderia pseudomallei 406e]|nr:conserved hypothetical protein [Burkholderia pseudomallei 406e]